MTIKRRDFLLFLGASAGTITLASCLAGNDLRGSAPKVNAKESGIGFKPVKGVMPLETDSLISAKVAEDYRRYEVVDDLIIPEGFTYDIIGNWGDKIGNSRFGYNNDYLSLIETGQDEGFLCVNFEYISGKTWMETYQIVIGKSLPFDEVKAAVAETEGKINAFALPDKEVLKDKIKEICREALIDLGLGAISIRKDIEGKWTRTNSPADRRITGISGLEDKRYLKVTGPAESVFRKQKGKGYIDKLSDRIIGTFANCAGGTSPWGTVFSAEENFQDQVPELVYPDGTAFQPETRPFAIADESIEGFGNVFGLAGNKYGWMVEIDPTNPNDYGTKHSWLGRFRHEAVAFKAVEGKPIAVYSSCDRRGGHIYKFISKDIVKDIKNKANSRLMSEGMLYAAVFEPNGTGKWIPLEAKTPINPVLPSTVEGNTVTLPKRPEGGIFTIETDAEAAEFKQKFATLGDLYEGSAIEKQGAILIDAHYGANAIGATTTARPEDLATSTDGSLYIAFTSGSPSSDGGPDKRIFQGPKGESPWEYGWIIRLNEDENEPASLTFQWESFAMGGEPSQGGAGFANPDNLEIDPNSNLWMVTDMSTNKHNQPVPSRIDTEGKPLKQTDIQGIFGNNSMWVIPTTGANAGKAYQFGIGPIECELTGPFFSTDNQTLFLSVQHPGEQNGMRKDKALQTRKFAMKTTDGKDFIQERQVPIGSNWPSKVANNPPLPAVVAIRRLDGKSITT
ncbi:MAG TPA: phosphatase [Cyanobacteria bacterium UBA11149]|nr:phosphatase [Cyanobacteria bacterium UBA11367]HBE61046.1 phosphatase [Cyanobacteria bacterium UBA11366]HBK65731.1 phosphatase [Cyanobacteria bacterium UBA11166]HBR72506.1 phosphatase [Cyanobacteria bacterium UBA11159]HBS71000.1 phosphatase [Cyanobacteria bacterium UBA11153]HBW90869.1 phosphatase [Cyanobacteria bacterium UBA11149]